jgi:hypothetical protein
METNERYLFWAKQGLYQSLPSFNEQFSLGLFSSIVGY